MFESSADWAYEHWLVTTPREREGLSLSIESTGSDPAPTFIMETDLSEETLLVHQYNIGTCATRRVAELAWHTTAECGNRACAGIRLRYEQIARDGPCATGETDSSDSPPYPEDERASEATVIRIPDRVQSYTSFGYQV